MNPITNQARITQINSELRQLNNNYDAAGTRLNNAKTKLDTLTSSQSQLSTLLDNYSSFPADYSNLGSSIWDAQFRGSLRQDFRVHLDQIKTHLQMLKSRHEDRLNIINNAVTTAERDVRTLTNQIRNINNRISLLERERRTLL